MARTKPSLAEALSPWSAPHDAADLLEGFRLSIVALAEEQHTGLPDSPRVLNALRLCKGTELAALGGDWPAMGVRRVGGAWTLDARQFDLWAQGADKRIQAQGRGGSADRADAVSHEFDLGGMMGYLTTVEVAELLNVKPDTVRKWRQEVGKGPRWTRWPGTRLVRYESAEVERWRHAGQKG